MKRTLTPDMSCHSSSAVGCFSIEVTIILEFVFLFLPPMGVFQGR